MHLGLAFYLGFIPLLAVAPYWFPIDPDVVSAAAAEGYNNHIAYLLVVLWSLGGVVTFAVCERLGYLNSDAHVVFKDDNVTTPAVSPRTKNFHGFEIAVVLLAVVILYFPPFLSIVAFD